MPRARRKGGRAVLRKETGPGKQGEGGGAWYHARLCLDVISDETDQIEASQFHSGTAKICVFRCQNGSSDKLHVLAPAEGTDPPLVQPTRCQDAERSLAQGGQGARALRHHGEHEESRPALLGQPADHPGA